MPTASYKLLIETGGTFEAATDTEQIFRELVRVAADSVVTLAIVLECDSDGAIASAITGARVDNHITIRIDRPAAGAKQQAGISIESRFGRARSRLATSDVAQFATDSGVTLAKAAGAAAPPAMMSLPLASRGRLRGVLLVDSPSHGLQSNDIEFLEALAERAAAAAEHVRLQNVQQAARRRAERAEIRSRQLQRATTALAAASTHQQVAEIAVRQTVAAMGVAGGRFVRTSDGDGGAPHIMFEYPSQLSLGGGNRVHVALETPDGADLGSIELDLEPDSTFDDDEQLLLGSLARETVVALSRVELAQAEHSARAAAEEANRAKDDFLAVMSHELRTPLSAIIGYASLLGDGVSGDLTATQRQQVSRISASARHLLAMIEDVLRYTQLGSRSARPELRRIDLCDVVREAASMIEPIVGPQGLSLELRVPEQQLEADSDARHVRQILLNLLSNAVKFTRPGGRVALHAEDRGDEIALSVSDTGIGIAPEHHAMIFEPFRQVDQRYSRQVGGVGVGLAIVRHLTLGLGGSVVIDSAPGHGSTFTVRLPRSRRDGVMTDDGLSAERP